MRARWLATAVAGAIGVSLVFAGAAVATPPVSLDEGYITDRVGVLSSTEHAELEQRLERLYSDTGVDLYTVFVDEFSEPADGEQWAIEVAIDNGLGPDQYLLAVATDAGMYQLSADDAGPLSDAQLDAIYTGIRPDLREGDWAAAVRTAAELIEDGGPGGIGSTIFVIVAVIAIIVAVIVLIVVLRRRRAAASRGAAIAPAGGPSLEELQATAATALVQTDDAIKTSDQELGFARAEFGDEVTVEFTDALATARTELNEAFSLKQQLDDTVVDTPQQTREWNAQIIELCQRAGERLNAKTAAFDELRQLEQNAPEALVRVQQERLVAAGTIAPAATELASLAGEYDPQAFEPVADNVEQANLRLEFADAELAHGQSAIAGGDGAAAAVRIRAAQEAVGQAGQLTAAVGALATDLASGAKNAESIMVEVESDIATATALPDPEGRIAATIAAIRTQLDEARTQLVAPKRPLLALQRLEAANAQIDGVIATARDAQARAARTARALGDTLARAQAQVGAAENYITTRRGAVRDIARTRLAEAGAALARAQALAASDPTSALESAQRAEALAGQALQAAQSDVGGFTSAQYRTGSGGFSDGLLGGILGGILSNAGGSSPGSSWGGFSGGSWGGSSSSRGSSRGSSRSIRSSRGGSTRSSRSSRSSRGGRF